MNKSIYSEPERLYIGGPMSGLPGLNYAAFHEAAAYYRSLGYIVISPAELHPNAPKEIESMSAEERKIAWGKCMRVDIAALMTCHKIAMLPQWERSEGATLERYNAMKLFMPVIYHAVEHAGA